MLFLERSSQTGLLKGQFTNNQRSFLWAKSSEIKSTTTDVISDIAKIHCYDIYLTLYCLPIGTYTDFGTRSVFS